MSATRLVEECAEEAHEAGVLREPEKVSNKLLFMLSPDDRVGAVIAAEFRGETCLAAITRRNVVVAGRYAEHTYEPTEWMYLRSFTGAHIFDKVERGYGMDREVLNLISAPNGGLCSSSTGRDFSDFAYQVFRKSDR